MVALTERRRAINSAGALTGAVFQPKGGVIDAKAGHPDMCVSVEPTGLSFPVPRNARQGEMEKDVGEGFMDTRGE